MTNGKNGGASEGSAHTQQPGVTSADLGGEVDRVDPDDVEIASPDEVSPPAGAPDDSAPSVNADLVDDADEVADTIAEASGEDVEIVNEDEGEPGSR